MKENVFAVQLADPKVIIWDPIPVGIQFAPTFNFAIGLPPKKLIDVNSGCNIMIRPELRYKNNSAEIVGSVIHEITFQVHFLKKIFPPSEMIVDLVKSAHTLFSKEFQRVESRPLEGFVPSFPENQIRKSVLQSMKDADWL